MTSSVNVYITVDTEFSAGGHFHDERRPPVTDRSVYCEIGGKSHGLGFMLETLKSFDLTATFFVEGAHTYVLGFEPMKRPVQELLEAGHDVQLHLHPMWLHRSQSRSGSSLTDHMGELTQEQMTEVIEQGLSAFHTWGAPRPQIFRSGGLRMKRSVYPVLARLGLPVSSSIGAGGKRNLYDPDIALPNGRKWIDGVLEIPITSYCDMSLGPRRHHKILTVVGSGKNETISVLDEAGSAGLDEAVILTHPFEFIKRSSPYYESIAPSRIMQGRFRSLCATLASGPYRVERMIDSLPDWLHSADQPNRELHSSLTASLSRIILNQINTHVWRL